MPLRTPPVSPRLGVLSICVLVAACSSTPAPPPASAPSPQAAGALPPSPAPSPVATPLPPIPSVRGPLNITVVYPKAGSVVAVRDTNFIFGSVGTGDATLTINGLSVPVEANGAFLAWIPVPDSLTARYDLVAVRGADTARYSHPIAYPPRRASADSADSVALHQPFPDSGRWVALHGDDSDHEIIPDTDVSVKGRPTPGGTYKWFLFPGTVVQVTGRSASGFLRVRLDSLLEVWVVASAVRTTWAGAEPPWPVPHRVVGSARVSPLVGWVDVELPIGERPPYLVEENGDDLVVTLYGTQASTDVIQYDNEDSLVRSVAWVPLTNDRAQFVVHLTRPPAGYLVWWDDASRRFMLRVRRPPVIDPAAPLRGRVIAIDPGHPPIGATGPTGLWEPVATLAVSQLIEAELTARGARVVMTRTTADPVGLNIRPVMARRANAEAFVSIHLNALPDGINPYTAAGTGTYFFQPQSVALARAVQAGMLRRMGLRDRGIFYDNLAVVRQTWSPAILCEGAFIIIPAQENALRTPVFQQAYADGVVDGLEAYFRSLAAP
jgi:N-acetylmuramoyl-L-alanine amidase